MGYSHYFTTEPTIPRETFQPISNDVRRVIDALAFAGAPLGSWDGTGEPEITDDRIRFNGLRECCHDPGTIAELVWEKPRAGSELMPWVRWGKAEDRDRQASRSRRWCGGDCSCETFSFVRKTRRLVNLADLMNLGVTFNVGCVKTGRKPYDWDVTAALIVAKHHLGATLRVTSDGGDDDWRDARDLCQHVLGYGDDYHIVDGELVRRRMGVPTSQRIAPSAISDTHGTGA